TASVGGNRQAPTAVVLPGLVRPSAGRSPTMSLSPLEVQRAHPLVARRRPRREGRGGPVTSATEAIPEPAGPYPWPSGCTPSAVTPRRLLRRCLADDCSGLAPAAAKPADGLLLIAGVGCAYRGRRRGPWSFPPTA